jgi:hypothetical protein
MVLNRKFPRLNHWACPKFSRMTEVLLLAMRSATQFFVDTLQASGGQLPVVENLECTCPLGK